MTAQKRAQIAPMGVGDVQHLVERVYPEGPELQHARELFKNALEASEKTMPDNQPVVTDSWNVYQECTKHIQEFLCEVTVRDSEVWLREVCLGSPDRPSIRAPLQIDSAELVHRCIERTQGLMAGVKDSLQRTVETSRRVMEDLIVKGAREAEAAEILVRTDALDHLRTELADAATLAPLEYHPAVLVRWCHILRQSFVSGDATVRVRVTTVYVL